MADSQVYDSAEALIADAGNRVGLKPYRVDALVDPDVSKTFYVFAPSNQAAIVEVARAVMFVHCRPVPTEDLLKAIAKK